MGCTALLDAIGISIDKIKNEHANTPKEKRPDKVLFAIITDGAENSSKDKLNLKKSLEDISHQLKTPLTSILVMLDNIIEDSNMEEKIRNDFIVDIKRNVLNINFLVQSLLKLSKFDANTVHFVKQENDLKTIVEESIKNVSTLCDLRNINIKLNINIKTYNRIKYL